MAAEPHHHPRGWPRWRSVRVRTTVAATLVVGLALLIASGALLGVLRRSLEDNVETSARLRAEDVTALLESGSAPEEISVEEKPEEDLSLVQVIDADGQVRVSSDNVAGEPPIAALRDGAVARVRGLPISPEDPYLAVASSTDRLEDGSVLTVLVARSLEPASETIGRVAQVLGLGLPLLLAIVAVTTWIVVGRALRPVADISAEVQAITDTQLDRRVPEPAGDDEIARLARTMNAMLARLQGSRDRQRQFVSDASHELRSPIASIRHQLEVALTHPDAADLPQVLADLHEEDLRMQQTVDSLLVLARADEGAGQRPHQPVDLDDIALTEARRVRAEGHVQIDASPVAPARVLGDAPQLARAVRNLVDNAARHARSRVEIGTDVQGADAVLWVQDDGPGVPADERERVFERFARIDDARARSVGGSGLGLAIVAEVVMAHHGTVRCLAANAANAASGADGGGARFEIRLPAIDVV
ncbi:MAG: sensor histidine kinase [Microthrixaceae bacterium]